MGATAGHTHGREATGRAGRGPFVEAKGYAVAERTQPDAGVLAREPLQPADRDHSCAAQNHTRHLVVQY